MMSIITFLLRFSLNLAKLLIVCIPLEVLGWIVLAPTIYLRPQGELRLPSYARWFDSADSYIGRDTSTYEGVVAKGKMAQYVWLAFRNPCNYFNYMYLAHVVKSHDKDFTDGNINTGDSQGKVTGLLYNELDDVYEYYLIYKWTSTRCFRFGMGWKIRDPKSNPVGSHIQWYFVIQPWKSYTGY